MKRRAWRTEREESAKRNERLAKAGQEVRANAMNRNMEHKVMRKTEMPMRMATMRSG
jgi:hypothetical protein